MKPVLLNFRSTDMLVGLVLRPGLRITSVAHGPSISLVKIPPPRDADAVVTEPPRQIDLVFR